MENFFTKYSTRDYKNSGHYQLGKSVVTSQVYFMFNRRRCLPTQIH